MTHPKDKILEYMNIGRLIYAPTNVCTPYNLRRLLEDGEWLETPVHSLYATDLEALNFILQLRESGNLLIFEDIKKAYCKSKQHQQTLKENIDNGNMALIPLSRKIKIYVCQHPIAF